MIWFYLYQATRKYTAIKSDRLRNLSVETFTDFSRLLFLRNKLPYRYIHKILIINKYVRVTIVVSTMEVFEMQIKNEIYLYLLHDIHKIKIIRNKMKSLLFYTFISYTFSSWLHAGYTKSNLKWISSPLSYPALNSHKQILISIKL